MLESKVNQSAWVRNRTVTTWDREQPEMEAKLAASMVERWGMIAAIPDGEDSAGRAKLRLATPAELAARACDTAEMLMKRFHMNGWIHVTPSIQDDAPAEEGKESQDEPISN